MQYQNKAIKELLDAIRKREEERVAQQQGETAEATAYDPAKQVEGYKERIQGSGLDAEKETDSRSLLEKAFNLPDDQNPLFDLFEVIGRPQQAIFGGIAAAQQGEKFGEGFKQGLSGNKYTMAKDILNEAGITEDSGDKFGFDDVLGFAGDVFADPVDLALIAAAPFTGGASGAVLFADKALDAARVAGDTVKVTQTALDAARVAGNAAEVTRLSSKLAKDTARLTKLNSSVDSVKALKASAEALQNAEKAGNTADIAKAATAYKESIAPLKVRKSVLDMGFRGAKLGITGAAKMTDDMLVKTFKFMDLKDAELIAKTTGKTVDEVLKATAKGSNAADGIKKSINYSKGYQDIKSGFNRIFKSAKDLPRELIKKSTKARGLAELATKQIEARFTKFSKFIDNDDNFNLVKSQISEYSTRKSQEIQQQLQTLNRQAKGADRKIKASVDPRPKLKADIKELQALKKKNPSKAVTYDMRIAEAKNKLKGIKYDPATSQQAIDASNSIAEKIKQLQGQLARYQNPVINTKEDLFNKLFLVYEYGYDSIAKNVNVKGVYKDTTLKNLLFDDFIMNNPLRKAEKDQVEAMIKQLFPDLFTNAKGPELFNSFYSKAIGETLYLPNEDLWDEVRKRAAKVSDKKDVVKEVTEVSEDALKQMDDTRKEINNIKRQTSQVRKTIINNKQEIGQLETKLNRTKFDVNRLEKKLKDKPALTKQEVGKIKNNIKKSNQDIVKLEADIETYKKDTVELEKQLKEGKQTSAEATAKLDKFEKTKQVAQNKLEELNKQLADAQKVVEPELKAYTKEDVNSLNRQLNAAESARADAKRFRTEELAKGNKEKAKQWVESEQRELARIKKITKEIEDAQAYIASGKKAGKVNADVTTIKAEIKQVQDDITFLDGQIKKIDVTDTDAIAKKIANNKNAVDELTESLSKAKTDIDDANKALKDNEIASKMQKKLDNLKKQLPDEQKAYDDIAKRIEESEVILKENADAIAKLDKQLVETKGAGRVVKQEKVTYQQYQDMLSQKIAREGLYSAEQIDEIKELANIPMFNNMLDEAHLTMQDMAKQLNDTMGTQFDFTEGYLPHILNPERDRFGVSFAKETNRFGTGNFKGNTYTFSDRKWKMAATEANNVLQDLTDDAFNRKVIKEDFYNKLKQEGNMKLFQTDLTTSMADFIKSGPQAAKSSFILNESIKLTFKDPTMVRLKTSNERVPAGMRAVSKNDLLKKMEGLARYAQDPEATKALVKEVDDFFKGGEMLLIDQSLDELIGRVQNVPELGNFYKVMGAITDTFKVGKLLSPGFQMRNFVGNFSNMVLAGVPVSETTRYLREANQILNRVGTGKADDLFQIKYQGIRALTAEEETLVELFENFVRDGFSEVGNALHDIPPWLMDVNQAGGIEIDKAKRALNRAYRDNNTKEIARLTQRIQDLTRTRTDNYLATRWGREVVAFNGRMNFELDKRFRLSLLMYAQNNPQILAKANAESAQEFVRRVLFDYTDLSFTERTKIKKLIPFYTFTKKNLAFQVQNLFENPVRYNRMIKGFDNLWDNISPEKTDIDQYKRENFWLPIPYKTKDGKYQAFRTSLPLGDFGEFLDKPLQRTVASTAPIVRAPFELAMNKQVFSGMPIQEFKGQKGFQIPELGRYGEYALSQVGLDVPVRTVADPIRSVVQGVSGQTDPLASIYNAVSSSILSTGDVNKTQTRQAYDELDSIRRLMKYYKQEGTDILKLSEIENNKNGNPIQSAINKLRELNQR